MSDSADVEEGEIGDISDFEDGSLSGSRPVSPAVPDSPRLGDRRSVSSHDYRKPPPYWPEEFGDDGGCVTSNRFGLGPKASLLQLLSDEEVPSHRMVRCPVNGNSKKTQLPVQKKRKKRRDWPQGSSRQPAFRHERARCRFFLEGRCNKGSECPFSHGFAPPKKQELCKFYATGGCVKGSGCLFLHEEFPCKFFHLSRNCFHGNSCKFSHKPLTPAGRALLDRLDDKPRCTETNHTERAASPIPPLQTPFPQEAITEPFGDVDYRRMVHTGFSNGPNLGIPTGFPARSAYPVTYAPPTFSWPNGDRPPGCSGPPPMRVPYRPLNPCRLPSTGYRQPPPFRQPIPGCPGIRYPPPHVTEKSSCSSRDSQYNDPANAGENSGTMSPDPEPVAEVIPRQEIPNMTVSEENFVSLTDTLPPNHLEQSRVASPQAPKWQLHALELQPRTPFSTANVSVANSADPRLKACNHLPLNPMMLSKELVTVGPKTADSAQELSTPQTPVKLPPKRRTRMILNENANALVLASAAAAAVQQPPSESGLPHGILDPRLLKRRRVEPVVTTSSLAAAAPPAVASQPASMRIVSSPQ